MTKKEDKRQLFAASFNFTSQCKILEQHNYKNNPLTATSQSPISGRKGCIYIIFSLGKQHISSTSQPSSSICFCRSRLYVEK